MCGGVSESVTVLGIPFCFPLLSVNVFCVVLGSMNSPDVELTSVCALAVA